MHDLRVIIIGPLSFISTLNELKPFLKFNSISPDQNEKCDIILFHSDALKSQKFKEIIVKSNPIKILASKNDKLAFKHDAHLELPTTIRDINLVVENAAAKTKFNKNSSIKIKEYMLNKNEKKLIKNSNFIILTEKEIQLLELFLNNKQPISKDNILKSVWNYSSDADTHTVETHIYRLRKKINDKFTDEKFILNDKNGYYL